ncbi:MAG TPA: hypothetical protein PKA64_16065, partial [Myxococcota bacterium]|nr:hypothetical protein [Myxococcota bacterium]
ESPKGDVYSLGLVALDLLRGEPRAAVRMSERGRDGLMRRLGAELGQVAPELEAEEQADVLALVEAMIAWEPDDRLDMTAAHERASALVDRLQGPRPRAWLAENVRRVQTSLVDIEDDAWVGQEIAEDPPTQPAAPPPPAEPARRASSLPWLLGSVLTAAVALWIGSRAVEPDDAARPTPVEPELPPSAPAPEAPATPPEVIDLPAPVQPPKARRSPGLLKTADPPAEPPAAPPAEPPPSEDASVSLAPSGDQGDISARRDGGSRRIQLPGALSPGSWRLFIGSSDAGPLEVRPGEAIVIECKRAFGTCRRR